MSNLRFRGDLRKLLEVRGMTQLEFAYASGLALSTVNKAIRGEEISHITFVKIIKALAAIEPIKVPR